MSKYGNVEFEKEVNKAYSILWDMFRSSEDKQSCEWDMEKEEKLHRIINFIDNELGR